MRPEAERQEVEQPEAGLSSKGEKLVTMKNKIFIGIVIVIVIVIKQLISGLDMWSESYMQFGGREGINMMSMLFCGFGGGIINAENSGQNFTKQDGIGFGESTILLIMGFEGNVGLRVNKDGSLTIGYGYDFTKESDPETFNRYFYIDEDGNIQKKGELENDAAFDTVRLGAEQKNIITGVDSFINGNGNGNEKKPLVLNQNQYDALFSFFYSNGAYVFTDEVYNSWKSAGGEKAARAEARKNLKEYLIESNGNYDAEKVEELFVACKGGNLNYEYKDRRKEEAELFTSK